MEETLSATQKRLRDCRKRRWALKWWRGYIATARRFRGPVDYCFGWRPAGILVLATLVGAVCFIGAFSWIAGIVGLFMGSFVGACVLYFPSSERLAITNQKTEHEVATLESESREYGERIARLRRDLQVASVRLERWGALLNEKRRRESRQYQRQQLLKTNWKALRSVPFEEFLETVFRELEYIVETTKVTGDQGADLIVSKKGHRIAIQVKGYFNSVSNSAVQEAHTAKDYYHCDASAVVTNSRFTSGAEDLASKVGCILIDEDRLPGLILGQVDLWELHLLSVSQRQQGSLFQGQDSTHLR